ncbi:tRNA(Met) cytidine acetate ligase [Eubacterium oxidoreducens]|uniref:tRNA(Met) cytidine acetate ligase n=1 Tax=Eubacterium oxidoreducens TaxID=1732 RepID=A0A1G6BHK5_EUBOX|nr:nucleotidyltransferase family protein [Eubacterium oxidoreducens]SDB20132.1 Predicted nucleotidyltransferase [Eubacterium oxidoreducens]
MKYAAIICEYNPFHNGHQYQIAYIKEHHPDTKILALMSGDFTQRGAPAIVDKFTRCEMALRGGADVVLELPTLWATASAYDFANGAIHLLNSLGCIDYLAFGCATYDASLFNKLATILSDEPIQYQALLKEHLKNGLSFPLARQKALNQMIGEDISSYINEPNNLLALEYLRALLETGSSIRPVVITRKGTLHNSNDYSCGFASGSAIRSELLKPAPNMQLLKQVLPKDSFKILNTCMKDNLLLCEDDFSHVLSYALTCASNTQLQETDGIDHDLADRIQNLRTSFSSWSSFCELLKTKNYTYTRISRTMTHLLLSQTDKLITFAKEHNYCPYCRILGCRQSQTSIIKTLKIHSKIPIIDRLSMARKLNDPACTKVLSHDIFASDIYRNAQRILSNKDILIEYQRGLTLI